MSSALAKVIATVEILLSAKVEIRMLVTMVIGRLKSWMIVSMADCCLLSLSINMAI